LETDLPDLTEIGRVLVDRGMLISLPDRGLGLAENLAVLFELLPEREVLPVVETGRIILEILVGLVRIVAILPRGFTLFETTLDSFLTGLWPERADL